jgi:hypothetical protein
MLRRRKKFIFVLALAAIALLAITTTADLLPHHHNNFSERVCPICHPPLLGLQPAAVKLPSLAIYFWATNTNAYISVVASPILSSSPRAPPSASTQKFV